MAKRGSELERRVAAFPDEILRRDRFTTIERMICKVMRQLDEIKKTLSTAPPSFVATFVIEPEVVNRLLASTRRFDEEIRDCYLLPHYQLAVAIPANTTVTLPLELPTGWLCTRESYMQLTSTYHSKDIDINIYVDYAIAPGCPLDLSEDIIYSFRDAYIKERRVDIEVKNTTATDFVFTIIVDPSLMKKELYNKLFMPVMKKSLEFLKRFAVE